MLNNVNWIGFDTEDSGDSNYTNEQSLYLRKTFTLSRHIKNATLYICAVGLGVCTVNGKKVTDDVYTTPFTRYDYRLIYQTYDITNLLCDKNAIGVHIGNGFYNDNMTLWNNNAHTWRNLPRMCAKIKLAYEDGSTEFIVSDNSWKVTGGPSIYNMPRQGELYDARLKATGFDTFDFDDSKWNKVSIVTEPGGILEPNDAPPIRVCKTFKPVKITGDMYDFGINMSGRIRVKLKGECGQQVTIKYGECLEPDGTINQQVNAYVIRDNCRLKNENIIILSGEEDEYAPEFCYHGFRYVQVINAPKQFEIVAEFIHTDFEFIGDFECSSDVLNKLHAATRQATLSNYMGIPTDCPHREQLGWANDAHLSAEQALMNYEIKKAYKKWLNDFKDVQRLSGELPGIVPTSTWGYKWGRGPLSDSSLILIPWYIYESTGDTSIIENMWENMVRYMGFSVRASDNLIACIGLGDWSPAPESYRIPASVTDTAYMYVQAVTMSKMAKVTGRETESWDVLAQNIRKAWREKFLNDPSLEQSKTFHACAVYQGLLNEDEIPYHVKKLAELIIADGYHIDCGVAGTKYIFTVLSEYGYIDVLYKAVVNPTYPGYGHWIASGMTTLCENWASVSFECPQTSHNHHMFSEVDNWMYKYIAGIRMEGGKATIKPIFFDDITSFKAHHREIEVEFKDGILTVNLPYDTTVTIVDTVYNAKKGVSTYKVK